MSAASGVIRGLVFACVIGACTAPAWAQGPGGVPGMPMQRMGPSRGPGVGLGTPGAPMARLGRSGGMPQAAPTRRSYGAFTGVGGVPSVESFRGSSLAGQARAMGTPRSAAAVVGNATQGIVSGSR